MKKLLYLVVVLTISLPLGAKTHHSVDEQFDQIAVDHSEAYNEFDSMADQLSERGMVPEQPKQLSKTVIFLRKFGGALFLKYLSFKGWAKGIWQRLFNKKAVIKHYPDCRYYKASY